MDALLVWCQKSCEDYGVEIKNFTTSWKDGLGFCALVSKYHPNLLDWKSVQSLTPDQRLDAAFQAAATIGVPALLDPEDITSIPVPEKLSMITYLSVLYKGLKSPSF